MSRTTLQRPDGAPGHRTRGETFVAQTVGDYVVVAHGHRAPTDADWESALDHYRRAPDLRRIRALIFTLGGAPNAKQRKSLNDVLGGIKLPMAVLTPSALARAVGTAIRWFQPHLSMFGPNDLESALDHLGAPPEERPVLRATSAELKAIIERAPAKKRLTKAG